MTNLPAGARVDQGRGGLERLVLEAAESETHIYTHGANVLHFQPTGGRPVLMVSSRSEFEAGSPGKPIRGGVPICFPWFGGKSGEPAAPPHGVARLFVWKIVAVTKEPEGHLRAVLALVSNDFTRAQFPHDFALTFTVTAGRALEMALAVRNTGGTPFTFEEALHSYLAVSDVRQIAISGLEQASYIDKTDAFRRKMAGAEALALSGETDRVFLGTRAAIGVADPVWNRRIRVTKSSSDTTIVWNPWSAKAKTIPDLGDDDWTGMVCVETANAADNAITLEPGQEHTITALIEVLPGSGA